MWKPQCGALNDVEPSMRTTERGFVFFGPPLKMESLMRSQSYCKCPMWNPQCGDRNDAEPSMWSPERGPHLI